MQPHFINIQPRQQDPDQQRIGKKRIHVREVVYRRVDKGQTNMYTKFKIKSVDLLKTENVTMMMIHKTQKKKQNREQMRASEKEQEREKDTASHKWNVKIYTKPKPTA